MKVLTIIQETRPGLLAEITSLLEREQIDVRDIDGEQVGETAVITVRALPYERCHDALREAGFKVFAHDQLLIRLVDEPGALAEISRRLANAEVDIRSIHIVGVEEQDCIVALDTADDFRARQLLQDLLV
ncbi:MAG: ACT domain-containing protein [Xanthomonadales bacterium]|nr:ACT domain-containing protein [Xanthomonadales bacterium]NIN58917.1 ACT domain-containing protein [Xanthomonadales bacterium]NIN74186.1 ACT domain-containing protein [Xanthomonadales bacterium]NIO13857.1 ACT domain-containing protein [Xanthomonadales bacterium]NIP11310.1 ACT domain-containing protein [Xanthomonadales bacterium]